MNNEIAKFLDSLRRPVWSIYCKLPSHHSQQIKNIPLNMLPDILLRYVLVKLSHTYNMNTKYKRILIFEFDKETGYITQLPNDCYGTIISSGDDKYIYLKKQYNTYEWLKKSDGSLPEIPEKIEKMVNNAFQWYKNIEQNVNMDMIIK